ncbi:MAG: hypothetical protein U0804_25965 [Gemmataceae bacterium]
MTPTATDHPDFLALLPGLERHARGRFRYLRPADRDDAVADVVAYGFASYLRLRRRGKDPAAFPAAFARFTARAVANGRAVGRTCGTRDVLAPAARRRHGCAVHRLEAPAPRWPMWWQDVLADPRADVPGQAAFAVDFPTWLASLTAVKRRVARLLAYGYGTGATARLAGVSPGRVSQLRAALADSWAAFHAGN